MDANEQSEAYHDIVERLWQKEKGENAYEKFISALNKA